MCRGDSNYRIKLVAQGDQLVGYLGPLDNVDASNGDVQIVTSSSEALVITVPTNLYRRNQFKLVSSSRFLGAERIGKADQARWSFRALPTGADIDDEGKILRFPFIWRVTAGGPNQELQPVWPNRLSLAAVGSLGGKTPTVWMRRATENLGPSQQALKMVLEDTSTVTNTRCRIRVLRSNGDDVGYLGPPRFGTSYPEPTPQMATTSAGALILNVPSSSNQQMLLKMQAPESPDYPYLGILPGIDKRFGAIPGLWHFRACNAGAKANADVKAGADLGAVLVWSFAGDDLRVYWPESKSYLTPRVFTPNSIEWEGEKTQLWLLSQSFPDLWRDSETVRLVLERF
ncbi:hypothetical protein FRB94_013074 [Tulasnella sp. JGI-2019a]|nr:hypothetical protein FRB94_013074 [Tulasnella sp. JGI-2019a]